MSIVKTNLLALALTAMTVFGSIAPSAASPEGKWFEKALSGNRIAQRHIAEGFEYGFNGFPKSLVFARRWYAIAAQNGDKAAAASLDRLDRQLEKSTLAFAQSDEPVSKTNYRGIQSALDDESAFSQAFEEDLFAGELDGYLLVGSEASQGVDGAYLPRIYGDLKPKKDADLPIRRH